VHEPAGEPLGFTGEGWRHRVGELELNAASRCAESELVGHHRLADEVETLRLLQGQSGQPGLEAADEVDPAT
jgi:hypothetical protein